MEHDLKNRASPTERLDVETPSQAREKQTGHQQEIPGE
jgi:hypothetical protein